MAIEHGGVGRAPLTVRPIEIADVDGLARMFSELSPESVYFRFFSPLAPVPPSTLRRLADVDHCRRDALVALHRGDIIAMAGYDEVPSSIRSATRDAEIAVTVDEKWQHRGVGRWLTRRLAIVALERGYDTLIARVLPGNRAALALIRKITPDATVTFAGGEYEARLLLNTVRAVHAAA